MPGEKRINLRACGTQQRPKAMTEIATNLVHAFWASTVALVYPALIFYSWLRQGDDNNKSEPGKVWVQIASCPGTFAAQRLKSFFANAWSSWCPKTGGLILPLFRR